MTFKDGNRNLLLGAKACGLRISELGVCESVERLGITHARQQIYLWRPDVVDMPAPIANGVSHQKTSVSLVKIANPNLDQLARRLGGLDPYCLSGQEDFHWGGLRWLRDAGWLGLSWRTLVHREVHASDVTGWFQLIVQSFGGSPDE